MWNQVLSHSAGTFGKFWVQIAQREVLLQPFSLFPILKNTTGAYQALLLYVRARDTARLTVVVQ